MNKMIFLKILKMSHTSISMKMVVIRSVCTSMWQWWIGDTTTPGSLTSPKYQGAQDMACFPHDYPHRIGREHSHSEGTIAFNTRQRNFPCILGLAPAPAQPTSFFLAQQSFAAWQQGIRPWTLCSTNFMPYTHRPQAQQCEVFLSWPSGQCFFLTFLGLFSSHRTFFWLF